MSNVININGTEHDFDELSDKAKVAYQQLLSISNQMRNLEIQLDQLAAARSVFEPILSEEIDAEIEDAEVVNA
jgi:hypothetical protein